MKIIHAFVGSCVESEIFSECGDVYGFGIEPTFYSQKNVVDYIQCDLRDGLPVSQSFDFGLFHPPCKKWSLAKSTSENDYENLIPIAKEIAEQHCDYWVIENVRNSPIGFDPDLRLNGSVFDLDLKYERCFWTNYSVTQPSLGDSKSYEYNLNTVNKAEAKAVKGYEKRYYSHDIIMNSMPKPYVEYLIEECPIF